MSATYTAVVQEDASDLKLLKGQGFSLQIAKSVADPSGKPSFNVVYASKSLAPRMTVQYGAEYGLNWTTEMPSKGSQVTYGGNWTSCDLGESFSLDKNGLWQPASKNDNAKRNCLNVERNNYDVGINVIVGIKVNNGDDGGDPWRPIWVGPNQLLVGMHGEYQPLEAVQIWYQQGTISATMISDQAGDKITKTISDGVPWYFRYIADKGIWQNQSIPFKFSNIANLLDVEAIDELVPLISVRKGVYFRNLSFGPIYLNGLGGDEASAQEEEVSA